MVLNTSKCNLGLSPLSTEGYVFCATGLEFDCLSPGLHKNYLLDFHESWWKDGVQA